MPVLNKMDSQYEIKAFRKAVEILDCFSEQQPELRLMDIQRMLGVNKSSLYRLLVNLEMYGMVSQDSMTGMYRLGTKFLHYSKICLAGLSLVDIAKPMVKHLAERTQETVVINVVQGDEAICIEKIDSQQPLKLYIELGRAVPLLTGASAKILAAYLPVERVRDIYERSKGLDTSFEAICDQLETIRRTGVAYSVGEHEANIAGVACPIKNGRGDVIAGLAILGPAIRLDGRKMIEYAKLCKECAEEISESLGL